MSMWIYPQLSSRRDAVRQTFRLLIMSLLECRPRGQLVFLAVLLKRRAHDTSIYLPGILNRGAAFGNRRPTSFGLRSGVWLGVSCLRLCLLPARLFLSTRLCLSAGLCLRRLLSFTHWGLGPPGLGAGVASGGAGGGARKERG